MRLCGGKEVALPSWTRTHILCSPIAFRFNLWRSLAFWQRPGEQLQMDSGRLLRFAVFGVCILDFFTPQRGGGSRPFKATAAGAMANLSTFRVQLPGT